MQWRKIIQIIYNKKNQPDLPNSLSGAIFILTNKKIYKFLKYREWRRDKIVYGMKSMLHIVYCMTDCKIWGWWYNDVSSVFTSFWPVLFRLLQQTKNGEYVFMVLASGNHHYQQHDQIKSKTEVDQARPVPHPQLCCQVGEKIGNNTSTTTKYIS